MDSTDQMVRFRVVAIISVAGQCYQDVHFHVSVRSGLYRLGAMTKDAQFLPLSLKWSARL